MTDEQVKALSAAGREQLRDALRDLGNAILSGDTKAKRRAQAALKTAEVTIRAASRAACARIPEYLWR